jgi:tetratricopeptide (TPR) repeat protein
MSESWTRSLSNYSYPVDLSDYWKKSDFPRYFIRKISGDRHSTIEFEDYFRNQCNKIPPWFEVVFWKMYSQKDIAQNQTDWIVKQIPGRSASHPELLIQAAKQFMVSLTEKDFDNFTKLLGYKSALATVATFLAFLDPDQFPMVDTRVAKWVNVNYPQFNESDASGPQLIPSAYQICNSNTTLTKEDFFFYIRWIEWTRYIALKLTWFTHTYWRARDVEMAIFTASGNRYDSKSALILNPIYSKQNDLITDTKSQVRHLLIKGTKHIKKDQWIEALRYCEMAIKFDPKNLNALMNASLCLQKMNRYDEAIKYYRKILDIDPMNVDAKQGISNCFKRLNNLGQADAFDPFIDQNVNYAPRKCDYWSNGAGRRRI